MKAVTSIDLNIPKRYDHTCFIHMYAPLCYPENTDTKTKTAIKRV